MKRLDLSGAWKLRAEFLDRGPESFQYILDCEDGDFNIFFGKEPNAFPNPSGFMRAEVPCDVITPLVEHGIIEEPLEKMNTNNVQWISDMSWWFVRDFDVDETLLQEDTVRLHIGILDFKADIIINNYHVAAHRNAFCALDEDIKRFLRIGKNTIIIRLTAGIEDHYPKDSISYYCGSTFAIADQRVHLRKPQYSYGWDWCKPVPTCGIGGEIHIEGRSAATITVARVDTLEIDESGIELGFAFEIDKTIMTASEDALLRYRLHDSDGVLVEAELPLILLGGLNFVDQKLQIPMAKLWWPNGYGEQALYTLTASIDCRGIRHEHVNEHVGIRTISLNQSPFSDGTKNFYFEVNGQRIFCKGGNWVPTDSVYLRTEESTYQRLIDEAKAANFTMLRMWGGGVYEPDCFYRFCSENGILIMQDFMFACAFYPDENPLFMHEVTREAMYQTKRLAGYPCLAIWTGNNEIHESYTDWFPHPLTPERFHGERIFNYVLPEIVKRNSPTLPYMPSSPYMGNPRANQVDEGDVHAWTYLGRDPDTKFKFNYELEAFDRMPARFSSEYGFYGTLVPSSIERYHAGEVIARDGAIWQHHGEPERKRALIEETIERHLTDPKSLDTDAYLRYSGVMQGLLYYEMAEAMRRKRYGSGMLIWMYNDCWPETGWTIIDYYLSRKISFYYLKRAFEPRRLILRDLGDRLQLTVINETAEAFEDEICFGWSANDGLVGETQSVNLHVAAHDWQQIEVEKAEAQNESGFYFAEGKYFDRVDQLRAYYRGLRLPKANLRIKDQAADGADSVLTIISDVIVPIAYLQTADDRQHFSDNYFTLYPGVDKTVRMIGSHDAVSINQLETD